MSCVFSSPAFFPSISFMEFEQVASRAVQKAALKAEKEGAKTLDIEEAKKKPAKDNAPSGGDTTGGNTSGGSTTGGETTGGGTGSTGNTGDGLE